jgi:hypothetical protein
MYRFKASLSISVEFEANDRHEAFDILRDYSDALEDGDGAYFEDLSEQFFRRVRVNIADPQQLHLATRQDVLCAPPFLEKETISKYR